MKYLKHFIRILNDNSTAIFAALSIAAFSAISFISTNLDNVVSVTDREYRLILIVSILVMIITLVEALMVAVISRLIFKRAINVSILFLLLLFLNLNSGSISRWVAVSFDRSPTSLKVFLTTLLISSIIVWLFVLLLSRLSKATSSKLIQTILIGGLVMLSLPLVDVLSYDGDQQNSNIDGTDIVSEEVLRRQGYYEWYDLEQRGLDVEKAKDVYSKYDVYYIIMDGYPSFDVLEQEYGLDDGTENFLEDNGFFVGSNVRPNYHETFMSIPSLLRFQYNHEELFEQLGISDSESIPRKWMKENETVQFMKDTGYKFGSFSAWSGMDSSGFDDYKDKGMLSASWVDIGGNIIDTTPLINQYLQNGLFMPAGRFTSGLNEAEASIAAFQTVSETVPNDPLPTFSIVYSWLPHPPLYYNESGDLVKDPYAIQQDGRYHWSDPLFKQNVSGINKELKNLISSILETPSNQEPLILITSDHGTANKLDKYKYGLDDSVSRDDAIRERFQNLSAFYFPDGDYSDLEEMDKLSLVNYGPIIFNKFLGQSLKLSENKAYYSEEYYKFEDVTDLVW